MMIRDQLQPGETNSIFSKFPISFTFSFLNLFFSHQPDALCVITLMPAPQSSEHSVLLTELVLYVQPAAAKAPSTELIKAKTATLFITNHCLDLHNDALNWAIHMKFSTVL